MLDDVGCIWQQDVEDAEYKIPSDCKDIKLAKMLAMSQKLTA